MTYFRQFFSLMGQALDCLLLPPILILLAVCAMSSLIAAYLQRKSLMKWRGRPVWLFIVHILLYPLIIWVPFLGGIRVNRHFPNRTAEFWLNVLFLGSIAFSGYLIYRMKGLRWVALSLVGFAEAILLSAFFVAEMAASGSWL